MKMMIQYGLKILALGTALISAHAGAAEIHLGLQGGTKGLVPGLFMTNGAPKYLPYAGAQISSTWPLQHGWAFRPGLEGNILLAPDTPFFFARADLTILNKTNPLYWGVGLGTGTILEDLTAPNHVPSSLLLTNVHGVLGHDFGNHQIEGMARLGILSSVGIRLRIKGQ